MFNPVANLWNYYNYNLSQKSIYRAMKNFVTSVSGITIIKIKVVLTKISVLLYVRM